MNDFETTPMDFGQALAEHAQRPFLPTTLSHAELQEQVEPQVRERALMMARVTNAEFGEKVSELCQKITSSQMSVAQARTQLGNLAARLGLSKGTEAMTDLGSDDRLDLILRTNVEMAYGYGRWRGWQDPDHLAAFPCLELYREFPRREPRDWPTRWAEAGGEFFDGDSDYPEGRMVAPVNSPIWVAISAFGTPYPPFDFNSGMSVEPVSREDAVAIGAWRESQVQHPVARNFADDAGASIKGLSDEMEQILIESLGGGWESVDGFLVKANEQLIDQLANDIFIANSFYGHEGRPGQRGGSLPKKISAWHFTTEKPFKQFDLKRIGSSVGHADPVAGFYLTLNKNYKGHIPEGMEAEFHGMEAEVNFKNPFEAEKYSDIDKFGDDGWEVRKNLIKAGYDGVIFSRGDEIVAFHPEQVTFKNAD